MLDIEKVIVGHDGEGKGEGWFLEKVVVKAPVVKEAKPKEEKPKDAKSKKESKTAGKGKDDKESTKEVEIREFVFVCNRYNEARKIHLKQTLLESCYYHSMVFNCLPSCVECYVWVDLQGLSFFVLDGLILVLMMVKLSGK